MKEQLEKSRKQAEDVREEMEQEIEQTKRENMAVVIHTARKFGANKAQAAEQLMQIYNLSHEEAEAEVNHYWK